MDALTNEFESIYPGITISIHTTANDEDIVNAIKEKSASPYDLFFTCGELTDLIARSLAGESLLADLSDVYENVPANGESKTVLEKLDRNLVDAFCLQKGNETVYYTMPWTQSINRLLSHDLTPILGQNRIPRTTNALIEITMELIDYHQYPFALPLGAPYYEMPYNVWWAQYEGLEQIYNYFSGFVYDESADKMVLSPDIAKQQGRPEALYVMESIINEYVYIDDWKTVQAHFINDSDAVDISMYPCGDWFINEMEDIFTKYPNSDIQYIRVPVVSALGEKLGITDTELSKAVDYADLILAGKAAQKPVIPNPLPSTKYSTPL